MRLFGFYILFFLIQSDLHSQLSDSLVISRWSNGLPKEVKLYFKDSSFAIIKKFSSGKIQCEIQYEKSGKLNGFEKCFYENGQIKLHGQWVNGVNVGDMNLWYSSGQKSFESRYLENGKPHGLWKGWYENGQIQYEQNYSNGIKTGKWINYKKDGGVESIFIYENGILLKEEKF